MENTNNTNTIKKIKIQNGLKEIRFYKNGIFEFNKIEIPEFKQGMRILIKAWLKGDLN
jgi:hypothetical protein